MRQQREDESVPQRSRFTELGTPLRTRDEPPCPLHRPQRRCQDMQRRQVGQTVVPAYDKVGAWTQFQEGLRIAARSSRGRQTPQSATELLSRVQVYPMSGFSKCCFF